MIKMIFVFLLIGGCSGFLLDRSYLKEMNRKSSGFFSPGRHYNIVSGDKRTSRTMEEIKKRTPPSKREQEKIRHKKSLTKELVQKEKTLDIREYQRYRMALPYLQDISERIYYLDLPSHKRISYMKIKRKQNRIQPNRGISLFEMREFNQKSIHLGMNKRDVLKNWGRPSRVDLAGDPGQENERWSFFKSNSIRHVYFENGVVQGWYVE